MKESLACDFWENLTVGDEIEIIGELDLRARSTSINTIVKDAHIRAMLLKHNDVYYVYDGINSTIIKQLLELAGYF